MAELESEASSLVNHLPQQDTSSFCGSGTSEVNKAELLSLNEDLQVEKNNILSAHIVNSDSQSNNVVIMNEKEEDQWIEETREVDVDESICNEGGENESSNLEIQENIKNEQMTQQHASSSSNIEDVNEECSTECDENNVRYLTNQNKGKKKKRAVHFPDDSCITNSREPPDPWKDATTWTTDDLITSYKKSCTVNGSKPAIKVLQQLHGISIPGKRKESLILKGEKLDQKQVECLEEIFRRVQFQLIDLEATHLDDECAVALFDMIEHYESACQLNVSFNRNISARGWQACSRLVRRTPTLSFLDIRSCDLNERTIPIFGRALKMGCHLTVLHMEGMSLTTRPLIILVAALKMNDNLQELFLAENKLVPTDGVQLGNLLRYNHRLNLLDLRNNNLQDVGVSHLCDGLVEQKSGHGLRTLVLWNNQISYQAMHALGRALAISGSLETLNIGHNGITNEGVHLLKDGLLKTTSLLRVGLQGTRISDEGAVALAEYIADSTILLRMDLRDNDIKTGGLMALSHAMRVNNSVTRIDLDKETKKESGMKDYAEVQIRLLRDILTFQERNVQLVMEREEAERTRLEKLAIDAAAAREKEKLEKKSEEDCPLAAATSNIESFTIIEAESIEMPQETETELTGSPPVQKDTEVFTPLPSVTFSEEEEQTPSHQRPSVLFARMGLQPQESLDSPRTPSDKSDVFQSPPETSAQVPPHPPSLPINTPETSRLAANAPPGEMLLSPQYYPKQLARKIFSVSRVNEEMCSSPPAFPSADGICEYDPLNVSLMNLVPVSNSQPSSSAAVSSTETSSIVSPNSLFENLANETVKHIVSAEESDVSNMSCNTRLSSAIESKDNVASDYDLNALEICDKKEICDQNVISCIQTTSSLLLSQAAEVPNVENFVDNPKPAPVSREHHNAEIDSGDFNQVLSDLKDSENAGEVFNEKCQDNANIEGATTNSFETSDTSDSQEVFGLENQIVTKTEQARSRLDNVVDANINDCEVLPSVPSSADIHSTEDNFTSYSSSLSLKHTSLEAATDSLHPSLQDGKVDELHPNNSVNKTVAPDISLEALPCDIKHVEGTKILSDKRNEIRPDKIELDGVVVNFEEEPWTSLEGDESNMAAVSGHKEGEEKQPDFFTTLSMNGLTQELASALTSLDSSSQDDVLDLRNPDDFERELDAMIAEVQNKPPSTIKN